MIKQYLTAGRDEKGANSSSALTAGEIIDQTILNYKENAKEYIWASLVLYGPVLLIMLVFFIFVGNADTSEHMSAMMFIYTIIIILITYLNIIFSGVITILSSNFYLGIHMSYKDAIKEFMRNSGKVMTCYFLVSMWLSLLFVFSIIAFFAGSFSGSPVLGVILACIPAAFIIYYIFSYFLIMHAVLIEGKTGMEALKRSKELVRSGRSATRNIIVIPSLVNILTLLVSSVPVVGYVIMLLIYSLPSIATTMIYYDILRRLEGHDILMAAYKLENLNNSKNNV